ncbi:hypothetical protein K1719_015960 [Acacia pycnantha]|nr:hypothetical protein K1719_015960 [Acacia pycnantha]
MESWEWFFSYHQLPFMVANAVGSKFSWNDLPSGISINAYPSLLITIQWNQYLISDLYPKEIATKIMNIPLNFLDKPNSFTWQGNGSGVYKVKDGYHILLSNTDGQQPVDAFWSILWKIPLMPKLLLLICKLVNGALPSIDILQKHHLSINDSC